jgi:signal transduction histidine kinase
VTQSETASGDVPLPGREAGTTEHRAAGMPVADGSQPAEVAAAPADIRAELTALRARNSELEAALRSRDAFIATLGHELRNPLSPIFLQVQYLSRQIETAPDGAIPASWILPRLGAFLRRLQQLLDTLDRLLELSRIEADHVPLRPEPLDLGAVVREVCGAAERELAAAGSQLTLQLHGDPRGRWDRLRIEQITRNLLSNAIRYGAGRPIAVTVSAGPRQVQLRVKDHGVGIAAADQLRIFEQFEQAPHGRQQGGFGLGLWIVRKLCTAMGGKVEVCSQPGEGAEFTVTLPRGDETEP